MKAPKTITWAVAVLIGLLGILLKLKIIAIVGLPATFNSFWLVVAGFALLALAAVIPGL